MVAEPINPTGTLKEGLTEQDIRPDPKVWPECTTCDIEYVLRHGWQFQGGSLVEGWFWQPDCKHKKAPAKMVGPGMADDQPDPSDPDIAASSPAFVDVVGDGG